MTTETRATTTQIMHATCYKIVIPNWLPARLNQNRGHWSKFARLKRIDRDLVAVYARPFPLATGKRSVRLVVTLSGPGREPDPDSFWKSLLDALVAAKMLIDDSRKWCALEPVEFRRGPARSTCIELTDMEATP